MKFILFFLLMAFSLPSIAQYIKVIYVFPGQGSDERLFSKLDLEDNFDVRHIVYPIPEKGETMQSFALKLVPQIDTTVPYFFLGTSLGGMLSVELTEILSPEKTIIISSAKSKQELPNRYGFMKKVPIYKLFRGRGLKTGARIMQPIVEPDRNTEKEIFKSMLRSKNPKYMKRTVAMIVEWERQKFSDKIVHIHGKKDHTLPFRNVKADFVVETGSHMMTLTRPQEIKTILAYILE